MIYFISNGEHIKIGLTIDSANTLRLLQEGSDRLLTLVHQIDANIEYETDIHNLFSKYRLLGTWYNLPDNYLEHISKMEAGETHTGRVGLYQPNISIRREVGPTKAMILEHLLMKIPHNDKAKINVVGLSVVLPISPSTAQRGVKDLVKQYKYLVKHSRSEYSISDKFFDTFPEYKNLKVL